jgi:hypothetical protein
VFRKHFAWHILLIPPNHGIAHTLYSKEWLKHVSRGNCVRRCCFNPASLHLYYFVAILVLLPLVLLCFYCVGNRGILSQGRWDFISCETRYPETGEATGYVNSLRLHDWWLRICDTTRGDQRSAHPCLHIISKSSVLSALPDCQTLGVLPKMMV